MSLPSSLGEFTIDGLLGEGGSAMVYSAHLASEPGTRLALKVLHPELGLSSKEVERFLSEAGRLRLVNHPAIVRLHSSGLLPDGRPFIAMPRLEGEALSRRLDRVSLSVAQATRLFLQVAAAVGELHQLGLIHRDIKPDNVFWLEKEDSLVLLDLGIARDTDDSPSTTTRAGFSRGTPQYMAPERLFGSRATIGTDVYELGLLYFVMLAGRPPWKEGDAEARLNPRVPSEIAAQLPPALAEFLSASIALDVRRRPTSVGELASRVSESSGYAAMKSLPPPSAQPGSGPSLLSQPTGPASVFPSANHGTPQAPQTPQTPYSQGGMVSTTPTNSWPPPGSATPANSWAPAASFPPGAPTPQSVRPPVSTPQAYAHTELVSVTPSNPTPSDLHREVERVRNPGGARIFPTPNAFDQTALVSVPPSQQPVKQRSPAAWFLAGAVLVAGVTGGSVWAALRFSRPAESAPQAAGTNNAAEDTAGTSKPKAALVDPPRSNEVASDPTAEARASASASADPAAIAVGGLAGPSGPLTHGTSSSSAPPTPAGSVGVPLPPITPITPAQNAAAAGTPSCKAFVQMMCDPSLEAPEPCANYKNETAEWQASRPPAVADMMCKSAMQGGQHWVMEQRQSVAERHAKAKKP